MKQKRNIHKLAASNIAWDFEDNDLVLELLGSYNFRAIEVAPTKLFADEPYSLNNILNAEKFANMLANFYSLSCCSIQSIWYGLEQSIFAGPEEREYLLFYTSKAMDFAKAIGAHNIVFGCPRNRNMSFDSDLEIAYDFFEKLAILAEQKEVFFALEANPASYGTNFLNNNTEVADFIHQIGAAHLTMNYDLGAAVENSENISLFQTHKNYISHIHISEPMLAPVVHRKQQTLLSKQIKATNYEKFISLEMRRSSIQEFERSVQIIGEIFDVA